MSQPRKSKAVGSSADRPRTRSSAGKASGDSMMCTSRPSRSKNKIPKSVRYDLENALIGLCDVWFEEIKPHLVRNNIKLHVQGSSAGGDHERPPIAPSARLALPSSSANPALPAPPAASAPGCSHLDPASSPNCELCRILLNAAEYIERPEYQAVRARPSPTIATAVQSHNCEANIRRKHRRFHPKPQPSWRVPRLCRTYTVLCRTGAGARNPMRRIASNAPPQTAHDDYLRFVGPRRVMKNKTTQTEQAVQYVSRGCQSGSSGPPITTSHRPKRGPTSRNPDPSSHDRASFSSTLPPLKNHQLKRPEPTVVEKLPLFQDDLIDIIAGSNDKRLKLLYSSSETIDNPSCMNLFFNNRPEKCGLKKSPPWR